MADEHESAVLDVLIELKQQGMESAKDLKDVLTDLNSSVKDVNQSLEKLGDRIGADVRSLVELQVASWATAGALTAVGAAAGDGTAGGGGAAFRLFGLGPILSGLIVAVAGLLVLLGPFTAVLAGGVVLLSAFVVGITTLASVLFVALGAMGAVGAGIALLGYQTTAGSNAVAELKNDLSAMAQVLEAKASPLLVTMAGYVDRFIPTVQKLGLELINWFGPRLPQILHEATQAWNIMLPAVEAIGSSIGKVVDYVLGHPQFMAFFQQLVNWGVSLGTGLLTNLVALSDWFLVRLPAIEKIALPIFGGIGNVIQGIGAVAGSVVDWFLKNWHSITTIALQAFNDIKAGFQPFADSIKQELGFVSGDLKDVGDHLTDLGPLWTAMGAVAALALETVLGTLDLVLKGLRELEVLLSAVNNAGAGVVAPGPQGYRPSNNPYGPHVPSAGDYPSLGPNTAPPSAYIPGQVPPVPGGHGAVPRGMTVLPIVFSPVPPNRDQLLVIQAGLRGLQMELT